MMDFRNVVYFLFFSSVFCQTDIDFSILGPYQVEIYGGEINPNGDSVTDYKVFEPMGNLIYASHLILSHGFSRNQNVMKNLAEHYASWGILTITMNLLHSSLFDNNPTQDALDLVYLSNQFGGGVIYAGQSSGGMRSVLAASIDTNAVAAFGLDLVDLEVNGYYLALNSVLDLAIPVWGLLGEPGDCNEDANGLPIYENAPNGNALRIIEADHCDFEDPTNLFCRALCQGTNEQFTNDEIRSVIRSLSTAFFLWKSGINEAGELWWNPGEGPYDELLNDGSITQLTMLHNFQTELNLNEYKLYPNYPNPFNPITNIRYSLKNESNVNLIVYNLMGNKVRVLVDGYQGKGEKTVQWDALDDFGKKVGSGVYYYVMYTNYHQEIKKMVLLK